MKKESKELALIDILIIPEYTSTDVLVPEFTQKLKQAAEKTKGLIYAIDEEGEKSQKADATAMAKFSRAGRSYAASVYKRATGDAQATRSEMLGYLDIIDENRQLTIAQFAEEIDRKLAVLRKKVNTELVGLWSSCGIEKEFQKVDIEPLVKLSGTLTDGGNFTKKARDFLNSAVTANLAEQNRIAARKLIIENRCFKADINPPFSPAHFGSEFYASDEIFDEKLDSLIAAEVERIAEMKATIERKNEVENKRKIEVALAAQQDESNRVAKENAAKEKAEAARLAKEKTENERVEKFKTIALDLLNEDNAKKEKKPSYGGESAPSSKPNPFATKEVFVSVSFMHKVPVSVSDAAAREHLLSLLPEALRKEVV